MEEKTNYLAHHGVKGMKWGVRRYQNPYNDSTPKTRKRSKLSNKKKKMLKAGALVAGSAIALYGVYKLGGSNAYKTSAVRQRTLKTISNNVIDSGKRRTELSINNLVKEANIDKATRDRYDRLVPSAHRKAVAKSILNNAKNKLDSAPRGPHVVR